MLIGVRPPRHARRFGAARALAIAAALVVGASGCAAEPAARERPQPPKSSSPSSSPAPPAAESASFASVVDGDTIETSAGTVRIIGIDTPERGECGHDEASATIGRLVSVGEIVTLELPPGQNDRDDYGRLVRHVTTSAGIDLGMLQLEAGNAVARYDSSDGYPEHPHEAAYRAAQLATLDAAGVVVTAACAVQAAPAPAPTASAENRWWEQYSSCTKLKKNGVGDPMGPFSRDDAAQLEIYNWFAFGTGNNGDGDDDGLACE